MESGTVHHYGYYVVVLEVEGLMRRGVELLINYNCLAWGDLMDTFFFYPTIEQILFQKEIYYYQRLLFFFYGAAEFFHWTKK